MNWYFEAKWFRFVTLTGEIFEANVRENHDWGFICIMPGGKVKAVFKGGLCYMEEIDTPAEHVKPVGVKKGKPVVAASNTEA